MSDIGYKTAKILLDTKSVLCNAEKPFVLTSGRLSPVYVDIRRLISFADERDILMDMAADMLKALPGLDRIDYLAGGETAGIPYAAFLADRLHKPMLYVRKKPKGFGRMAQIEGCMDEAGKHVVMVEDLQTDGGSKKVFIDALRESGAIVEHSFVVFHYGTLPQSEENNKKMGVTLQSLATWWDILEVARAENTFDTATLTQVEEFLNDPDGWAEKNADRASSQNG